MNHNFNIENYYSVNSHLMISLFALKIYEFIGLQYFVGKDE